MTRPTKLAELNVEVERLEPKPFSKLRVADVMSPHVPSRDAAHDSDEPVVERARAQSRQKILSQALTFRTAKGDIDDQCHIYYLFGLE